MLNGPVSHAGGNTVNDGTLVLNGDGITVTPDVIAQGISLVNHVHGGVEHGVDRTERPQ